MVSDTPYEYTDRGYPPRNIAEQKTYGTASPTTTRQLQDLYYSSPQLSECKDIQCLRRKSLQDILAAQTTLIVRAPETIKGVPLVTRESHYPTPHANPYSSASHAQHTSSTSRRPISDLFLSFRTRSHPAPHHHHIERRRLSHTGTLPIAHSARQYHLRRFARPLCRSRTRNEHPRSQAERRE